MGPHIGRDKTGIVDMHIIVTHGWLIAVADTGAAASIVDKRHRGRPTWAGPRPDRVSPRTGFGH